VPERREPAGHFILYTVYFILEPVGRSLAATKGVRLGRGLHGASYFILYTLYFTHTLRGLHGACLALVLLVLACGSTLYCILYTSGTRVWRRRGRGLCQGTLYFILYTPSREGPLPDGLKYKV